MRKKLPHGTRTLRITSAFSILSLYQFLSVTWVNPFLPRIELIFTQLRSLANFSWLNANLVPTLAILFVGYLFGVTFGICAGVGFEYMPRISRTLLGFIAFGRSIPSIAKISALFAIFGITRISQIFSVFLAVFFIMTAATFDVYRHSRNEYRDFVALYSLSEYSSFLNIFLKASLNRILTASKFAFQIALIATLISEMYSSSFGLGAYIMYSQATFNPTGIWAGIVLVGIMGIFFNGIFKFAGHRILDWEQREEKGW